MIKLWCCLIWSVYILWTRPGIQKTKNRRMRCSTHSHTSWILHRLVSPIDVSGSCHLVLGLCQEVLVHEGKLSYQEILQWSQWIGGWSFHFSISISSYRRTKRQNRRLWNLIIKGKQHCWEEVIVYSEPKVFPKVPPNLVLKLTRRFQKLQKDYRNIAW